MSCLYNSLAYLCKGFAYVATTAYNAYYGSAPQAISRVAGSTFSQDSSENNPIRESGTLRHRAALIPQLVTEEEQMKWALQASLAEKKETKTPPSTIIEPSNKGTIPTQPAPVQPKPPVPQNSPKLPTEEEQMKWALQASLAEKKEALTAAKNIVQPTASPAAVVQPKPLAPQSSAKLPTEEEQMKWALQASLAEKKETKNIGQSTPAPATIEPSNKGTLSTQPTPVQPKPSAPQSSARPLTEAEQIELAIKASLRETSATKNVVTSFFTGLLSSRLPVTTSGTPARSVAEQEKAEMEKGLALSKTQVQYMPMLGKKILMTERIAEKRKSADDLSNHSLPIVQKAKDVQAEQRILKSIDKDRSAANQLEALALNYKYFQPIRGDGNCFYTSFAFDMLLNFRNLPVDEKKEIIRKFSDCNASPAAKLAVVDALKILLAEQAIGGEDRLMLQFVECLRAIGVQYVEQHRAEFDPFLVEPMTYDQLIKDLGTMQVYAQGLMIMALVKAMNHPVQLIVAPDLALINYDAPHRAILQNNPSPRVFLLMDEHYQLLSNL